MVSEKTNFKQENKQINTLPQIHMCSKNPKSQLILNKSILNPGACFLVPNSFINLEYGFRHTRKALINVSSKYYEARKNPLLDAVKQT